MDLEIPKLIHQTWKNDSIPSEFQLFSESWTRCHPGWDYKLWTDEMNEDFIRTHFPGFLARYLAYPKNIQRVDAVRYFILHHYGGIFVDLDFECIRNFEPLLRGRTFVVGREPDTHCDMHGKELIICNALIASIPGNSFLDEVLRELDVDLEIESETDLVLESTGPFMLTRVYDRYFPKTGISVLEPELVYPLTKDEISLRTGWTQDDARIGEAYAIHYYAGTWWKGPLSSES